MDMKLLYFLSCVVISNSILDILMEQRRNLIHLPEVSDTNKIESWKLKRKFVVIIRDVINICDKV